VQAGLDGIRNKMHPGEATDFNLYEASAEELAQRGIRGVPSTLKESINALEQDNAYLLEGGVFTEDVIEKYVAQKNDEWTGYLCRPTPYEYNHYFDA
jgi:glutamine synthetase